MYILNNKTWKRNTNKHKATKKYKKYKSTKSQHKSHLTFTLAILFYFT